MQARERTTFVAVLWGARSPAEVATHDGVPEDVVLARLVRALRAFADLPRRGGPLDVEIGRYLLHGGTTLERDDVAMYLGAQAGGLATIGGMEWGESTLTDYGNRPSVGVGRKIGMLKPQFNSIWDGLTRQDFGTIAVKTAAAAA